MSRRPKLPRAPRPWPCVILAIDPGKVSGWAILREGRPVLSGTATTREDRERAVGSALCIGEDSGLPLVVVGEKWTPGGRFGGARTMAGLGAAWGRWEETLDEAGVPKTRRLRVNVQTWRAATIGGPQRKSEQWKADAVATVRRVYQIEAKTSDEAEAVLVGRWAESAGEVGRKLPKRTLRECDMERFVA
ncbi:MAG: hypothetical protein RID81_06895 [Sandaracinaceae bacterium]